MGIASRDMQLAGTYVIEDDAVCMQSPTMFLGHQVCTSIYYNPEGSREDQNEYILVNMRNVAYASVRP